MKYLIILMLFPLQVYSACYRECEDWDTFCKSPAQIIATKCRLGVPVKHELCEMLNIPKHYLIRGGGSLVDGLPCSEDAVKTYRLNKANYQSR